MKSKIRNVLYCLVSIYGLYFTSACCTYCYQIWDGTAWAHQEYSMDSVSLESFKSKYLDYCKGDKVRKTYCSPYHSNVKEVKFIRQEKEKMIDCNFYSDDLKALMNFYVEKGSPLRIYYWGIVHSCDSDLDPKEYAWNINDGSKSFLENYKYIKAFENEILCNISGYKRDNIQGSLCWYSFYFVHHFFLVCLLGVLLVLLLLSRGFQSKGICPSD